MSFILDALKKSEKERQRDAVPGISDLPVVVQRTRTSAAIVSIIAAMAVGLVALGWAWWRASSVTTVAWTSPARDTSDASAIEPAEAPAARSSQPAATRSLASEATRIASVATPPAPAPPVAEAARATAPDTGVITPGPMSILDARASGMSVPELTLELLVFSDDPARRFVYINSAKYVEGDTLAAGPRLEEITTEGAILSYRGQDFLLPQD